MAQNIIKPKLGCAAMMFSGEDTPPPSVRAIPYFNKKYTISASVLVALLVVGAIMLIYPSTAPDMMKEANASITMQPHNKVDVIELDQSGSQMVGTLIHDQNGDDSQYAVNQASKATVLTKDDRERLLKIISH